MNLPKWAGLHSSIQMLACWILFILPASFLIIGCSREKQSEKPKIFEFAPAENVPKFLLVDLGSLNFEILRNMLAEDRLPNMKRLIEYGDSVLIESPSCGFFNDAAVSSEILTGKPAGFNGIAAGCWGADNNHGFVSVGWEDLTYPPLWDQLSGRKINCLIINWPLTHPAPRSKAAIISDNSLLCPDEGIHPPQLREYLNLTSILPREEKLKSNLKGILESKDSFENNDIEALNRFLNFPLSEDNLETLVEDNIDPGPDYLKRSLRILAWELRKDHLMLSVLSSLKVDYYLPEFIAVRSGLLEVAQSCFMRFHYARGFNISPAEMERFGAVVERCYEYEDELVGKLLKIADSQRDVILVSGFQLEPMTFGKESLIIDSTIMATRYRGRPVSMRVNPADMAHSLNAAIQPKMDVIFHPPLVWPVQPYLETTHTYEFTILPYSVDIYKIRRVIDFLATCNDSSGQLLFSQAYISDTSSQKIAVAIRPGVKPGEQYNAGPTSIFTDDFISPFPQISVFPRSGGFVILSSARWTSNPDSVRLSKLTDLHDLILREMVIEGEEKIDDSLKMQITNPSEKSCDRQLGYRFKALGYLK